MFKYTTTRREYQEAELIKWLEVQVRAGKIMNRAHYAQVLSVLLSQIKNDSSPITQAKVVGTDEIISSSLVNEFMRNINVDIGSVFSDGSKLGSTVNRRVFNSKKFYNDIKADVNRLTKSISLQRSNAHGNIGSNQQLYVETFTSPFEFMMLDTIIDGKKGELRLSPSETFSLNDGENINRVELSVYPVDNENGGVRFVSYPDRDIEKNYSSGSRDILENGLWEVMAITDRDAELYFEGKKHSGIIAVLDIWFESQSTVNYIQYDAHGTYDQEILYIKYKQSIDSDWQYIIDSSGKAITDIGDSGIEFFNFIQVNPIAIRIAIKQDDRIIMSKSLSDYSILKEQIENDISSSRMGEETTWQDQFISSQPESDEVGNLYESLLSDIEKATSPEVALQKVRERLIPKGLPDEVLVGKRLYTIGAHSIDIENRIYKPNQVGLFYSHNPSDKNSGYVVNPSTIATGKTSLLPSTVSVESSYSSPGGSTVEFFIVDADNSIEIPVMVLSDTYYKEPANFVRSQVGNKLVVQLTYPVEISYSLMNTYSLNKFIKVYMNGVPVNVTINSVDPINSINWSNKSTRQFELVGINPNSLDIYSVEYKPNLIDSSVAWIINPGDNPTNSNCLNEYPRYIFAKKFIADRNILAHGEGCKCKAVPTYVSSIEWNNWGIDNDNQFKNGIGEGYSSEDTKRIPIPLYIKRIDRSGE